MPGLKENLVSFIGRRGLCQEVTQVKMRFRVQEKEMDAYRRLEKVVSGVPSDA
jgi:ribosomal protein S28E/S33